MVDQRVDLDLLLIQFDNARPGALNQVYDNFGLTTIYIFYQYTGRYVKWVEPPM